MKGKDEVIYVDGLKVIFSEGFFDAIPENWVPAEGAREEVLRQLREQVGKNIKDIEGNDDNTAI